MARRCLRAAAGTRRTERVWARRETARDGFCATQTASGELGGIALTFASRDAARVDCTPGETVREF